MYLWEGKYSKGLGLAYLKSPQSKNSPVSIDGQTGGGESGVNHRCPVPEKCRREKCPHIKDAGFGTSTASAAPAWFHLSRCRGMVPLATVSDVCRWGSLEDKG